MYIANSRVATIFFFFNPFFSPLPLLVFALRDYTVMLEGESQPPSPSRVECLSFLMIQFGRPAPQMPVNPGHV